MAELGTILVVAGPLGHTFPVRLVARTARCLVVADAQRRHLYFWKFTGVGLGAAEGWRLRRPAA